MDDTKIDRNKTILSNMTQLMLLFIENEEDAFHAICELIYKSLIIKIHNYEIPKIELDDYMSFLKEDIKKFIEIHARKGGI